MKPFCFIFLVLLIASCTEDKIKIVTSSSENANIKEAYIRTTKIEINDEVQEVIKEPKIEIISPKDGEIIKDGRLVVMLNISNFKLVAPDNQTRKNQGHVQVWVDGMEFRGSKTEFIFENESNGTHVIKAELMMSNNSVLPYSKTIKVFTNKT